MATVAVSPLPTFVNVVLLALAVAVVFLTVFSLCAIRAPLFDPPGLGVRLGLYLRTNVAVTSSAPVLPELAPIMLRATARSALHALVQAGVDLGWREVSVDETRLQVRAVVVSALFRFSDDLHIRLLARGADRSEALVRSSSRVGRGDLGANVHHIMALRAVLADRALLAEDGR